jgi:hypothetical protein
MHAHLPPSYLGGSLQAICCQTRLPDPNQIYKRRINQPAHGVIYVLKRNGSLGVLGYWWLLL